MTTLSFPSRPVPSDAHLQSEADKLRTALAVWRVRTARYTRTRADENDRRMRHSCEVVRFVTHAPRLAMLKAG